MNYKKIIKDIKENNLSKLDEVDRDFIDFIYGWHIKRNMKLSAYQKMNVNRIDLDLSDGVK